MTEGLDTENDSHLYSQCKCSLDLGIYLLSHLPDLHLRFAW